MGSDSMKLGRSVTDRLWVPTTRNVTTIQVIEHVKKEGPEGEVKKVPFGFSRVLGDS